MFSRVCMYEIIECIVGGITNVIHIKALPLLDSNCYISMEFNTCLFHVKKHVNPSLTSFNAWNVSLLLTVPRRPLKSWGHRRWNLRLTPGHISSQRAGEGKNRGVLTAMTREIAVNSVCWLYFGFRRH